MSRTSRGAIGAAGFALALSGLIAFVGNPFGGSGESGAGIAVSTPQVLDIVADAGTLGRADRDAFANTFVASNLNPDGGSGKYSFISNTDSAIKFGPGTQAEISVIGNAMTVNVGSLALPTTTMQQPACPSGTTCRWFADTTRWFGVFPSSDVSGCVAGAEGGIKANTTGHRFTYCDGTTAQQVAYRAAWSGDIDFGAIAGGACADGTFAASGAVASEAVACGGVNLVEDEDAFLAATCSVSATDTVRVRACCQRLLGNCANPVSITFSAAALR